MQKLRCAVLGGILVSSLAAQGGTITPGHAEQWSNGCGQLPYGRTWHRFHQLYEQASLPASLTPGKKLVMLGWRRCASNTVYPAVTIDLEVSLFSVPLTQATLTTTFATNRASGPGGVAFLRKKVNLPALAFGSPAATFHLLPLDAPHTFAGPSLLVEAVGTDTVALSNGWSVDTCIGGSSGAAGNLGLGCGPTANTIGSSASGGSYLPGTTISITQAAGPANLPAINMLGFSMAEAAPGVPLPLDLTPLGATNCTLYTSIYFSFPAVLDASGAGMVQVGVPTDPAFSGVKFSSQWLNVHPAAPGGFSLSAVRRFEIGPIRCDMAYMYRFSDNLDTTGSKFLDRGPIMRVFY